MKTITETRAAAADEWADPTPANPWPSGALTPMQASEEAERASRLAPAACWQREDNGPAFATWHARCRAYASQGLIPALKPGSPAAVEA